LMSGFFFLAALFIYVRPFMGNPRASWNSTRFFTQLHIFRGEKTM